MKMFTIAFLISLFLGTGIVASGGGDFQQQMAPQTKIVVVPGSGDGWVSPAIGAAGLIVAAGIGLYATRGRRKEN